MTGLIASDCKCLEHHVRSVTTPTKLILYIILHYHSVSYLQIHLAESHCSYQLAKFYPLKISVLLY